MHGPGEGAAPSLPPAGDEKAWNEADWHWDPLAMTATAVGAPARGAACAAVSGARPATGGLAAGDLASHGGATPSASSGYAAVEASGAGASTVATTAPAAARAKGKAGGRQRKAAVTGPAVCQADGCGLDLSGHTFYHQRNKICPVHIKADVFLRDGQQLRFCQRCGHAHALDEFDAGKHSCRKQLEKHNARRRKRQQEQAAAAASSGAMAAAGADQQQQALAAPAGQGAKRSRAKADASPPLDSRPEAAAAAAAGGGGSRRQRSRSAAASDLQEVQSASALFEQAEAAAAAAAMGSCPAPLSLGLAQPQAGGMLPFGCAAGTAAGAADQPCLSGPASSSVRESSASGSAAATAVTVAGAAGTAGLAAAPHFGLAPPLQLPQAPVCPPSPPLPLLDFDVDLSRPVPSFGELGSGEAGRQCQQACDSGLADELEAWLNANLAAEDDELALVPPQQAQQGWGAAGAAAAAGGSQPGHWGRDEQPASLQMARGIMQQQVLPADPLAAYRQRSPPLQPPQQAAPAASPVLGMPVLLQGATLQQAAAGPPVVQLPPAAAAVPAAMVPPASGLQHSRAPCGSAPPPTLATVSVKLFGCTPAELPPNLREHLRTWFKGAVDSLEGYLRPGCVHLTAQALLTEFAAARLGQQQAQQARQAHQPAEQQQAHQQAHQPAEQQQAHQQAHQPAEQQAQQAQQPPQQQQAHQPAEQQAQQAQQPPQQQQAPQQAQRPEAVGPAAPEGQQAAPQKPPSCCQPKPEEPAADPAAATAAASPSQPAAASPAGCCGRKRAAEAPAQPAAMPAAAVRRVVQQMLASGEALWRSKTMLVQAGGHVALVHRGHLRQTWDIDAAPAARAVPAILEVSPPLLLAAQPAELRVSGLNMLQNDCQLLLRLQGRYVQPAAALCGDCTCQAPVQPGSDADPATRAAAAAAAASFEQRCCGCCVQKLQLAGLVPPASAAAVAAGAAEAAPLPCCGGHAASEPAPTASTASSRRLSAGQARLQSVRLLLPAAAAVDLGQGSGEAAAGLRSGLLHLDIQRRAYTAPKGARVLVVSSPAVHAELLALAQRDGLPQQLLDQLGVVHEWLGRPEKMQYQLVEATAARLLYWAVAAGLPATASLLLSVLQSQSGGSAAAAAGVLQRALQPVAADGAVAGALARMDGLAQLHLSIQATSAAAMQRAAELACADGLSLLHRAVQSGCADTLRAVLAWGEDAGSPWRCDLAGPMGLTPLHLAALLPDAAAARQAVLLLVSRCASGSAAWDACCTADGKTPADFWKAAAAARSAPAAAAAPPAAEAAAAAAVPALAAPLPLPAVAVKQAVQQQQPPQPAEQQQQAEQRPQVADPLKPGRGREGHAAAAAAAAEVPEMQPSTPRKNPGCLCAPGCPCALLDRCACCSGASDDEDEQSGAANTCGAGSGKCCCCSGEPRVPGCAGCEGGGAAAAGAAAGACCGGEQAATKPSCCGGK